MLPRQRYELEEEIKALAGGVSPEHGDTLVYDKKTGWKFIKFTETIVEIVEEGPDEDNDGEPDGQHDHNELYYTKAEVDALISGEGVEGSSIIPTSSGSSPEEAIMFALLFADEDDE